MSESNRDKKLVVFSSSVTERGATEEGKKEKLPKEALPPKNILESLFFQARANGFCRCLGTRQGSALTCVCTVTSCVGGGVRSFRQHNSRKTTTVAAPFSRKRRGGGGGEEEEWYFLTVEKEGDEKVREISHIFGSFPPWRRVMKMPFSLLTWSCFTNAERSNLSFCKNH